MTTGIQHRLAGKNTVLGTAVEDHFMLERVRIDTDQLHQTGFRLQALTRPKQLTQPNVFRRQ